MAPHTHRSITIAGAAKLLRDTSRLDAVLGEVSPASRAVLEDPTTKRSHPGSVMDETFAAYGKLFGMEALETLVFTLTGDSFTGILGPIAKVYMTLAGGGPQPMLARYDTMISAGMDGFKAVWKQTGDRAGLMTVTSDAVTPPAADHVWKGATTFLLHFAKVEGTVTILPRENAGRTVQLSVSWN